MKIFYEIYTHKGKIRPNNEDGLLVMDELYLEANFDTYKQATIEGEKFIFVVADGMGGHSKGEVATKEVLETIREKKDIFFLQPTEVLEESKKRLNQYIKNQPNAYGLGCALAGIIIQNENAKIFNVGDCRVYKFINNKLIRISKDHSVVEELLSDGLIEENQVKAHPKRHILTSAIMGDDSETISQIYLKEIEEIYPNDTFLICSDGLWDELEKEEIQFCLNSEKPAMNLIEKLNQKLLKDNVSFIYLKILPTGESNAE